MMSARTQTTMVSLQEFMQFLTQLRIISHLMVLLVFLLRPRNRQKLWPWAFKRLTWSIRVSKLHSKPVWVWGKWTVVSLRFQWTLTHHKEFNSHPGHVRHLMPWSKDTCDECCMVSHSRLRILTMGVCIYISPTILVSNGSMTIPQYSYIYIIYIYYILYVYIYHIYIYYIYTYIITKLLTMAGMNDALWPCHEKRAR